MKYKIHLKMAYRYSKPTWFTPVHETLESAQMEVAKLRQWEGDSKAIKEIRIVEDKPR